MSAPRPDSVVVELAGAALGVEPAAEVCGLVVEAGAGALDWQGKPVVVPRILPCGDCRTCRRGFVAQCQARFMRPTLARRQLVPARWLTSVEPPLGPEPGSLWQLAALADAALAPYTALAHAGVGAGDRVVVVGDDARAELAVAIAAAKGAVVSFDEGEPIDTPGAVILVCDDRRGHRARAFELVAPGASIILLDTAESANDQASYSVDWSALIRSEARVIGVLGGHPDLLPELCALVATGRLALADHVRRVPWQQAVTAHAEYLAQGGVLPIAVP